MIITCACGSPAALLCIHPSCSSSAYLCSEECPNKELTNLHLHGGKGIFITLEKFDKYVNNLSSFKFRRHIEEIKERLAKIYHELESRIETYQSNLRQLKMKLKSKTECIINKFTSKEQISGRQASYLLKGEDLYENQQDTTMITNRIKNCFTAKIKEIEHTLAEQMNLSTIAAQSNIFIKKGGDEMWNNNWSQALSFFEQSRKIYPLNPTVISNIGRCLVNLEKYDEAIQKFNQSLSLATEERQMSLIYNSIGQIYEQNKGDLPCAIEYYSKAIQMNENYYFYFLNRGRCNKLSMKYNDALYDLNEAINLKPIRVCYDERASILEHLGRFKEAEYDRSFGTQNIDQNIIQ